LATAREFLAQKLGPLQLGAEMMRLSAAADRLVRTPSVQQKIRLIADALLQRGSLTAAEIAALSDAALRA
jgi:hypothetical protein